MGDFERIESKLDKVIDTQTEHGITLVRNTVSLEEHIKRTDILEQQHKQLRKEVEPLKKAHHMWAGVGKAMTVLAALLGLVATVIKLLR